MINTTNTYEIQNTIIHTAAVNIRDTKLTLIAYNNLYSIINTYLRRYLLGIIKIMIIMDYSIHTFKRINMYLHAYQASKCIAASLFPTS